MDIAMAARSAGAPASSSFTTKPISVIVSDILASLSAARASRLAASSSVSIPLTGATTTTLGGFGFTTSATSPLPFGDSTSTTPSSHPITSPPSTFSTSTYVAGSDKHSSASTVSTALPAPVATGQNHLSSGALVAAILVPIFAFILLCSFFVWLLLRRRRSHNLPERESTPSSSSILPGGLKEKFSRNTSSNVADVPDPVLEMIDTTRPAQNVAAPANTGNVRPEQDLCVGDFGLSSTGPLHLRGGYGVGSGSGSNTDALRMPILTSAQNNSYFTGLDTSSPETGSEVSNGLDEIVPGASAVHYADPPPPYPYPAPQDRRAFLPEMRANAPLSLFPATDEMVSTVGGTAEERRERIGRKGEAEDQRGASVRRAGENEAEAMSATGHELQVPATPTRPGTAHSTRAPSITSTLYSDTASVHSARETRMSVGAMMVVTPESRRGSGEDRDPFDDPSTPGSSADELSEHRADSAT